MKKITAILALLLVQSSYALELQGDKGVEIIAIDGLKVKSTLFSGDETNIEAGKHQIVVRYIDQFSDELIQSRPAIFSIDMSEDTTITAPDMTTARAAKRKIDQNITWLVSSKSDQYEVNDSYILKGKGFMPYANMEGLIAKYNTEQNITLANTDVAVATTATVVASSNVSMSDENTLISLYQQSTKDQKKAFRMWLLEQDMK